MAIQEPTINLTQSKEIWLPIPGYEGIYSVSNLGQVRRDKGGRRTYAGRLLKPSTDKDGYLRVDLYFDKIPKHFHVHKLVTLAFLGLRPLKYVVNHKDTNKKNNRVENLEYVTDRQNKDHAKEHGLYRAPSVPYDHLKRGSQINTARLTEVDIPVIRNLLKKGWKHREIAKQFGVTRACISFISRGEHWKHVSDKAEEFPLFSTK
jgi:hypothetical protein